MCRPKSVTVTAATPERRLTHPMDAVADDRPRVFAAVERLVSRFRADASLELEVRLVSKQNTEGRASVSAKYFLACLKKWLETWAYQQAHPDHKPVFSRVRNRHHFLSQFFERNVRGRFTVSAPPEYVQTQKIDSVDVHCPKRDYFLRFVVKQERPLSRFKPTTAPTFVRCHERWTFVAQRPVWRFDFTKVCSGEDKQSACSTPPEYEIELEVQRQDHEGWSSLELATRFVELSVDLLGRYDPGTGKRENLPLFLSTRLPSHNAPR